MENFRAVQAALDSKTTNRMRAFRAKGLTEARTQPVELDEQLDGLNKSTVNEKSFWEAIERLAIEDDLAPEAELELGRDAW